MKRIENKVAKERIAYTSSIRARNKIIMMILKIMNIIMQIDIQEDNNQNGQLSLCTDGLEERDVVVVLRIDKMSRLFLILDDKIHSFQFPFSIKTIDNRYVFHSQGSDIDNITLSFLISIYNSLEESNSFCSLEDAFMEEIENYGIDCSSIPCLSNLVGILQTFEIGYLRYDYDDDVERVDEETHPINHLDINFSNSVTYKIGLENDLNCRKLEDIIDVQTKCKFIKDISK